MKYLRRYLSPLFALVMLLGAFSIVAFAKSGDRSNYMINYYLYSDFWTTGTQIDITNDSTGIRTGTVTRYDSSNKYNWTSRITLVDTTGSYFAPANKTTTVKISNLYYKLKYTDASGAVTTFGGDSPDKFSLTMVYTDGTSDQLFQVKDCYKYIYNDRTATTNLEVELTPKKDIYRLVFYWYAADTIGGSGSDLDTVSIDYSIGVRPSNNLDLDIEVHTEEAGLIKNLTNIIKDFFGQVITWLEDIGSGISDIFAAIVNLPHNMWVFIEEGLQSLFVPSVDSMTVYKDKWLTLLADRLGGVYQASVLLFDSFDGIMQFTPQESISFPLVTVNLAGTDFVFGGWEIDVVPDSFQWLADIARGLSSVVMSISFINGLRKRYDEVMGVEK